MKRNASLKAVLSGILLAAAFGAQWACAKEPLPADSSTVSLSALPVQGVEAYRRIYQGGPFPHEKDGSVFGNRERLLPGQKRGYYREYTVVTPDARDRGARRIVCGGQPRAPDACYYTADHYASFRKIVQ